MSSVASIIASAITAPQPFQLQQPYQRPADADGGRAVDTASPTSSGNGQRLNVIA